MAKKIFACYVITCIYSWESKYCMEMTNKQQENRATDRASARDKSTASTESMRQKFDILATNQKKSAIQSQIKCDRERVNKKQEILLLQIFCLQNTYVRPEKVENCVHGFVDTKLRLQVLQRIYVYQFFCFSSLHWVYACKRNCIVRAMAGWQKQHIEMPQPYA